MSGLQHTIVAIGLLDDEKLGVHPLSHKQYVKEGEKGGHNIDFGHTTVLRVI